MENPAYHKGWYRENEEWYLTRDALLKELKLSGRAFAEITATTQRGGINQDKLRCAMRMNAHNKKWFTIYCLEDMKALLKPRTVFV